MKTLFKSQDLWDLVKNGFADPDEEARLRENKKKDSKALFFIQQAVITVKLQTLRQYFETLHMKSGESMQEFLSRVAAIVNQIRSYAKKISDQTIVAKVLRSLTPKFDHVVAAIEKSKDLAMYSFDELTGSLQSHEARLNRLDEKNEKKAFHVKGEASHQKNEQREASSRGRGRGGFHGRGGHGRGRGRGDEHQNQKQQHRGNKSGVKCYYCNQFGHIKANYWKRKK
ncbi:uncharacterized protein LOC131182952 [Hevea brasiliensis]|uniref:uncharacterized protein LOC131182952 n=1 Tax=Hevea brasiliensis TaxID=3981 RepID=UPI0025D47A6E|nr:uncharacterized protein LOC131182952 [Hevea brasiliensis]